MAKRFLSDEDMAKLEQSSPSPRELEAAPAPTKKRFLSDEDMNKREVLAAERREGPTLKGAGEAIVEGVKDIPAELARGINPIDLVSTAAERATDMLPGKGLLTRLAANVPAGAEYLYDKATGGKERPYSEVYEENLKEINAQNEAQRNKSYLGGKLGDAAGIAASASLPASSNLATRVAVNTGIGAIEAGTSGDEVFDEEAAEKGGKTAAAISGAIESIPYLGKALRWTGKNVINKAGLGVGVKAQERYLENPEGVRKAIASGDEMLGDIKHQVDEAYHAKVTLPREEAAANLQDAKAAKREAARETKDYIANLKNIKPPETLTDEVIQSVRKENAELTNLSSKAYDTLDGLEFDRGEVLGKISEIKKRLLVDGQRPVLGDSVPAWGILERLEKAVQNGDRPGMDSLMNQAEKLPGIAGKDLKRLIQQLDQESGAAYTTYGSRGAAKHIKDVRGDIDPLLKANPAYAEAMVPTAEQAGLVAKLTKIFGNPEKTRRAILVSADPERGKGIRRLIKQLDERNGTDFSRQLDEYHNAQKILRDPEARMATERMMMNPSERALAEAQAAAKEARDLRSQFSRVGPGGAENTIKSIGRGKNLEGEKQLRALVGDDVLESIKDFGAAQGFVADKTNGSRRTLLGAVLGSGLNVIPGGAVIGASTGAALDTLGGTIARRLLDGSLVAGPYLEALERAAKSGRTALAATHLYLMENKPEYRAAVEASEAKK